jgi:hypothetical protein
MATRGRTSWSTINAPHARRAPRTRTTVFRRLLGLYSQGWRDQSRGPRGAPALDIDVVLLSSRNTLRDQDIDDHCVHLGCTTSCTVDKMSEC